MNKELVLIVDFGGQYNQLIARRVREAGVYCEIIPFSKAFEAVKERNPKGIIFTGGPNSAYEADSPTIDKEILNLNIPILGICYGDQLLAHIEGGVVEKAEYREYGNTVINFDTTCPIFKGIDSKAEVFMSHTDHISRLPEGYKVVASTDSCVNAAMVNIDKNIYGIQFHPEVKHSQFGHEIIKNFLFEVCNLRGDWSMSSFIDNKIKEIKELAGDKKVICALSGGVDSSVAAVLV
ncbi:MAG: glutamine-hydrolyzing GMP synthase, partial [Clostridium sp.]